MVSGADGRFKVERAPRGRLRVMAFPENRTTSTYIGGLKMVTVPADAREHDIGDVELLISRVGPRERAGDLGFTLVQSPQMDPDQTKLEVASIRPGGPADGSGLAVGDVIVSVDDTDVTAANATRYWALSRVPAGTVLELGLARGAAVSITAGKPR
jgi:S1-C subfamily serine protease